MSDYKRKTRLAAVAALSDSTTGFNAKLGALGQSYGIQPFSLEFALPSRNVVYGFLTPDEVEVSQITDYPAAVIYSNESVDEKRLKPATFSGFVNLVIDLYFAFQKLDAPDYGVNQPDFDGDFEKWLDAAEDAMVSCLKEGRTIMQPLGVNYVNYRADRDPIQSLGDGHFQKLTFTLGFEVHVS
jgi:hypothetical protein